MTPIEVLGIYDVLTTASEGNATLAYLLALLAMVLTASSYAQLAKRYPETGAAYHYARQAINPTLGFLVGWATLLDYCFIPLVCWLIGATYLHATFPGIPTSAWIIVIVMATTIINIYGIAGASRLNIVLMSLQLCVIAVFLVLCWREIHAVHAVHAAHGAHAIDRSVVTAPLIGAGGLTKSPFNAAMIGAAIAAYSFLGFDALCTLSEETIAPQKNVPRAIILTVALSGSIFIVCAYALQLAAIGHHFGEPLLASIEIASVVGGNTFAYVITAGLIVGEFAAGVVAQASVGRLLYAIARDRMLPGPYFCRLHPRFKTPVTNILLVAAFGTLALTLSLQTVLAFISFGAFLAFTVVNLCVIRLYFLTRPHTSILGVCFGLLLPTCGAVIDIWLLTRLDVVALWIGSIWLALGVAYLGWRTRCFTRALPVPPPA